MKLNNIDYYQIKRWFWLLIIITFCCAMCVGCSASYYLTKAYEKDSTLVLSDTLVQINIKPVEPINFDFNISTLDKDKIVLESIRERDTIKIYLEKEGDLTKLEVDCPDCIDSIVYVPQIRFVKEELSNRELFKQAKERLSDFQIARLAAGQLISLFLLGALVIILLRIFLTKIL